MGCCQSTAVLGDEEERAPLRQAEIDRIKSRMNDKVNDTPAPAVESAMPPPPAPLTQKKDTNNTSTSSVSNPTTPDRYVKKSKLGKGAFGVVWKAMDTRADKYVAIKIIQKESLSLDEGNRERLTREVSIMKSLTHPNLVTLYGFIPNDAQKEVWMIVEYIDGSDLMQKVEKQGKLTEPMSRDYFQQMLVGMNYVHSQNVVHRDLKPDNILIERSGIVKITDFGLSNVQKTDADGGIQKGFSLKTCCGTPYYVAPEVIQLTDTQGYSGFTCDIWSLGIILFVMLTGETPFSGENLSKLLENITKGVYFFPQNVSLSSSAKQCIRSILVGADKRVTLKELASDPWVSVAFDKSQMENVKKVVQKDDPALYATIKTIRNW